MRNPCGDQVLIIHERKLFMLYGVQAHINTSGAKMRGPNDD